MTIYLTEEKSNQRYLKNLISIKMVMFLKLICIDKYFIFNIHQIILDLQQRMKHILTQDEIRLLIQYLDPENKGFSNFTEFSQKIRNGMTILDENGTQIINVNTQPSKTTIIAATSFLPELQNSIDEFKKPFMASKNRSDYKPSTRYGATPNLKDTFANIVPLEKSGLWQSAEQRFNKNREEYLQEEKKLKIYRQEQKIERIRSYNLNQQFFYFKVYLILFVLRFTLNSFILNQQRLLMYQKEIRERIKSQDDRLK